MTTGAPKTAVTALTESSMGAKSVRAMRSHLQQKTAPARKHAGVTTSGRDVPRPSLARCGAARPTNEAGPAKAVTQAVSRLDASTMSSLSRTTPTLCA